MEVSEKELYKILFALDREKHWRTGKITLEHVIDRVQSIFKFTVDDASKVVIKNSLDCFLITKRRRYTSRGKKVDYEEILKGASSEVLLTEEPAEPMDEERPILVQETVIEENEERTEEMMEETPPPPTTTATATTTNYKHLDNLTWMQQKRRTQDIYDEIIAVAEKEKVKVSRLIGLFLKRADTQDIRVIGDNLWKERKLTPNEPLSFEKTLAIYTDNSLGRRTYTNQKKIVDEAGYKIFIPWKQLRLKMKIISPVIQNLNHPHTGVYFPFLESLQITVSRILETMSKLGLESRNLIIQIKYGFDGSGGHSIFHQLEKVDTNNIIIVMFCPLSITDDQGNSIWNQDSPNVANTQRPLMVQMGKESHKTLQSLTLFENDIKTLTNEGMVVGEHNVKLTILGHMLDRKAADIFTGLGGSYCDLCDFSKEQCLQKDIVQNGFEITRDIETLNSIFEKLVSEDGVLKRTPGDYDTRSGMTNQPITEHDVFSFQVLHGLLRTFDHFMKTVVHVTAGVLQWSVPQHSVYNQFLSDNKHVLQDKIETETGISWDKADPTGNSGTSTTGNTARRLLLDKHVRESIIIKGVPERYQRKIQRYGSYLAVTLRVIVCKRKVNVYEFKKMCTEFYIFLLEEFSREVHKELQGPWISITPTLHKVIGHSWELIERNEGYGLGRLDESGMESCNKVLRSIRIKLSRKCSQAANLQDIINRMWITSDPVVNVERSKVKPFCRLCSERGHSTRYCSKDNFEHVLNDEDALFNMLTTVT